MGETGATKLVLVGVCCSRVFSGNSGKQNSTERVNRHQLPRNVVCLLFYQNKHFPRAIMLQSVCQSLHLQNVSTGQILRHQPAFHFLPSVFSTMTSRESNLLVISRYRSRFLSEISLSFTRANKDLLPRRWASGSLGLLIKCPEHTVLIFITTPRLSFHHVHHGVAFIPPHLFFF